MKNLAKFLSGILLFIFVSSNAFAQNLNGSWYEDTLHERSRLRNYFYRINGGKLSVVDKKNNKEETFFDFTIDNGYIDIRSTGKTSPKISVGKFPIQIKDDNYFTIEFSKPMSFVRNSYAKEQAVDATKTAATVAAIGYGTAIVGAVGEKAVVASGLAGGASKASASTSKTNISAGKLLPVNNGIWKDPSKPGNSLWIPDSKYVPQKFNPSNLSWKQIMNDNKIKGIEFKNGYPNFSNCSKATVKIEGFTNNRSINFAKAYEQLVKKIGQ